MIHEKLMKLHVKDRIVVMLMASSICCVILCIVITTTMGIYTSNLEAKKALALNAELLASRNAAALAFGNPDFSRDSLKLLKEQKNIIGGCILSKDGIFASYGDEQVIAQCRNLPKDWQGFFVDHDVSDAQSIVAVRNIYSEGEWVGGIMLISNQQRIYDYLYSQLTWGLLIIGIMVSASFLLARLLQGYISKPIMNAIMVTERFSQEPTLPYANNVEKSYEYDRIINALNNIMHYANNRVQFHKEAANKYASALKKSGESMSAMNQSLKRLDNATLMVNALLDGRALGSNIQDYEAYIKDIRSSLEHYKSRFDAVTAISRTYESCLGEAPIPLDVVQSIVKKMQMLMINEKAGKCSITLDLDAAIDRSHYLLHERAWNKLSSIIFEVLPMLMAGTDEKYAVRISFLPRDSKDQLMFELSLSDEAIKKSSNSQKLEELIDSLQAVEEVEGDFFSDETITKDDFFFIISCARYIANVDNIGVEILTDYPFCNIILTMPNRIKARPLSINDETVMP